MTKPTNGTNVGNAVRELAPNTTWRLHHPGEVANLEWLDDPALRPTDEAIATKTAELDADPNYPPEEGS
jgi:hypothetical protein